MGCARASADYSFVSLLHYRIALSLAHQLLTAICDTCFFQVGPQPVPSPHLPRYNTTQACAIRRRRCRTVISSSGNERLGLMVFRRTLSRRKPSFGIQDVALAFVHRSLSLVRTASAAAATDFVQSSTYVPYLHPSRICLRTAFHRLRFHFWNRSSSFCASATVEKWYRRQSVIGSVRP